LEEIDEQNWKYAHRLFQCVTAASRPLDVNELAEFLAFDFEAGSIPTFLADWRPEDPVHTVLSICSSLLVVIEQGYGPPVVQFAHFSVKEYLTSARLAEAKETISHFHVSMAPAHTVVAQACLGVLLHLDETVTKGSLGNFPLAEYAAEHWVGHAQSENVLPNVVDGTKRLFDPSRSHLSVWTWIYDPETTRYRFKRPERPKTARATPLHYAAFCGMHDITAFLIAEHTQDVNARGFGQQETPLHVASRRGHAHIAHLLLEHGADANAQDLHKRTPLFVASKIGHVEVARVLLEHGADTEVRDWRGYNPLLWASETGHTELVSDLLKYGADAKAHGGNGFTSLHFGPGEEIVRLLLEHGADANAPLKNGGQTPLHLYPSLLDEEVARVVLEHGADVNARDATNATPLHEASHLGVNGVIRLLLQYGADIHARDDKGQNPFMKATEKGRLDTMELLLERGAEDHRPKAVGPDGD
jgi:ankyrin repeat protein